MSEDGEVEVNEDEVVYRPEADQIIAAWTKLFQDPMLSMGKLKGKGLAGLEGSDTRNWTPLRSLHWKLFHGHLPSPNPSLFPTPLSTSRATYDALRQRYLLAPDGRWASDVSTPEGVEISVIKSAAAGEDLGRNNPLSLDGSNPWKTWFKDIEIRKEIRKDVERTFPDIQYFTFPRVRRVLTTLLFLYSVLHPDVGYRQGMHELCASILLAVDLDSLATSSDAPSDDQQVMYTTLSREFVEHDTWTLFEGLMKSAKTWYEWREENVVDKRIGAGGNGLGRPPPATKPQQAIVDLCHHLHHTLTRSLDPQLYRKLEDLAIEPQIYGIRWIRLIFTREFSMPEAMRLWDGIFAEDSTLKIVEYICVAMLLRIRNQILPGDYGEALSTLLRYPTSGMSIPALLSQAIYLRENNVSPSSGVQIIMQNQELFGIPAQPPEPQEVTRPNARRVPPQQPSPGRKQTYQQIGAGRLQQVQQWTGPVAKNLLERAQASGLDKAFLSTVSEIRKNLPEFPASPPNLRPTSASSSSYSTIPTSTAVLQNPHQPTSELKAVAELETELAMLKKSMGDMSLVLGRCLESLEDSLVNGTQRNGVVDGRQGPSGELLLPGDVSLAAIRLVRDVLGNPDMHFDPGVIYNFQNAAVPPVDGSVEPSVSSPSAPPSALSPSLSSVSPLPPPSLPSHYSGSQAPPLYLSTRDDKPLSGLSRSRSPGPLPLQPDSAAASPARPAVEQALRTPAATAFEFTSSQSNPAITTNSSNSSYYPSAVPSRQSLQPSKPPPPPWIYTKSSFGEDETSQLTLPKPAPATSPSTSPYTSRLGSPAESQAVYTSTFSTASNHHDPLAGSSPTRLPASLPPAGKKTMFKASYDPLGGFGV